MVIALALLAAGAVAGGRLAMSAIEAIFGVPAPDSSHPGLVLAWTVLAVTLWLLLSVLLLTSVASAVGGPFWESLSDAVERDAGAGELARPGFGVGRFLRELLESLAVLVVWIACAVIILLVGLIPVVGTLAGGAMELGVGGFFLVVELTRPALTRRGMRLRERLGFVWRHRWPVLAFGAGAFALFLVPPMSLIAMPGAVVGATRLVRRLESPRP